MAPLLTNSLTEIAENPLELLNEDLTFGFYLRESCPDVMVASLDKNTNV